MIKRYAEKIIFNVKWLLTVFYFGLITSLLMYMFSYIHHLIEMFTHPRSMEEMKLFVLDTVDAVMVANLVKMVITGSYNSFVSRGHGYSNENLSSDTMKVKVAASVCVVAMVYLLRIFVTSGTTLELPVLIMNLSFFGMFLVAALVMGALEYMHVRCDLLRKEEHGDKRVEE